MSEVKVIFTLEGRNVIIQCKKEDKMKDICNKYSIKIEKNINSLIFLYGGNQLNLELSYEEIINKIDKNNKEMRILVYEKEKEEEYICPKCGEKIKLNKEKIDEIILNNNNIKDKINGIKLNLDNIINNSLIESMNIQLKNINLILNIINEDIQKNNQKILNLLNNIIINEDDSKKFLNNIISKIIFNYNIIILNIFNIYF